MFRFFLLVVVIFSSVGCSNSSYHFYSPDKTKCITILTEGDIRYFINGYHDDIPDSNFVKVSLTKIDRHVADQVAGCWDKDSFEWVILMDNVKVVENKLNKKRFLFKQDFPTDTSGIPNLANYSYETNNCFSMGFEYNKLVNTDGSILK